MNLNPKLDKLNCQVLKKILSHHKRKMKKSFNINIRQTKAMQLRKIKNNLLNNTSARDLWVFLRQ